MAEEKELLELITKVIADDGTIFTEDYKSTEKRLLYRLEEYNKDYHEWYEFRNFVVDEQKLEKWEPENWEHFKWVLFRKFIKIRDKNWHNGPTYKDINIDKINSIDSSEKFVEFMNEVYKDELSDHIKVTHTIYGNGYEPNKKDADKIIFGSGLLKIDKEHDIILKSLWKRQLERLKYAVEFLNLEITTEHLKEAFDVQKNWRDINRYENFFGETAFNDGLKTGEYFKVEYKNPFIVSDNKEKTILYYYTKKQEEMLDILCKNYKGSWDDFLIKILNAEFLRPEVIHFLYHYTKKNKIKLIIHKEKFDDLVSFYCYWNTKGGSFKNGIYSYRGGSWSESNVSRKEQKMIGKDLLETIFMKFPFRTDQYQHGYKISDVIDILRNMQFEEEKIWYYLISSYGSRLLDSKLKDINDIEYATDICNELKSIVEENKKNMPRYKYHGYGVTYTNTLSKEELDSLVGVWKLDSGFDMSCITSWEYYHEDKTKCTCEKSTYECPIHGEEGWKYAVILEKETRKMTFEEYLEFTSNIKKNSKYKEKLEKELEEIEKKKKELEDKIKSVK